MASKYAEIYVLLSLKKEGFEIVTGNAEGVDKHPGTLPGASKIKLKLIFSKNSASY